MKNEELTMKIKRISKISLCIMVIYTAFNLLAGFFPIGAMEPRYSMEFQEHTLFENIISIISILAVVFSIVASFVTIMILLNELGRKRTPFTGKIGCLVRNLGIYMIIFELSKAVFVFIAAHEINIDIFWLLGLLFYAFSLVFRYGKNLQQESDETL
ncbi:MAG: hypothetical protein K5898_02860 [Ruminococcus sp.]|uniref:hypothetical protein n=1 Tax=Ruminococcus sp. TaxID=41978 RepID=UPI0025F57ADD|nr:hypothetical protein [Ruminococcus sp.]MCR4794109.1 hypothetical protein [Ruminococcus sp.]